MGLLLLVASAEAAWRQIDPFRNSRASGFVWKSDREGFFYYECHGHFMKALRVFVPLTVAEDVEDGVRRESQTAVFACVDVRCPSGHALKVWMDRDTNAVMEVDCHDTSATATGFSEPHAGHRIRCEGGHTFLLHDGPFRGQ